MVCWYETIKGVVELVLKNSRRKNVKTLSKLKYSGVFYSKLKTLQFLSYFQNYANVISIWFKNTPFQVENKKVFVY